MCMEGWWEEGACKHEAAQLLIMIHGGSSTRQIGVYILIVWLQAYIVFAIYRIVLEGNVAQISHRYQNSRQILQHIAIFVLDRTGKYRFPYREGETPFPSVKQAGGALGASTEERGSIVDRHSFINASCMHTGRFWRLFRLNSTELSVPCSPSIMACRRGALSPLWL